MGGQEDENVRGGRQPYLWGHPNLFELWTCVCTFMGATFCSYGLRISSLPITRPLTGYPSISPSFILLLSYILTIHEINHIYQYLHLFCPFNVAGFLVSMEETYSSSSKEVLDLVMYVLKLWGVDTQLVNLHELFSCLRKWKTKHILIAENVLIAENGMHSDHLILAKGRGMVLSYE